MVLAVAVTKTKFDQLTAKTEVAEIVKNIINSGSDEATDLTGFPVKSGGLYIAQKPSELAELIVFLQEYQHDKGAFLLSLEMGIASGGTLKIIRDYINVAKTVIVDNREHPNVNAHWDRIKELVKSDIVEEIWLDSCTEEVRQRLLKYDGFGYIFLDTSHDYYKTRLELDIVYSVAKNGALFVLHDTCYLGEVARICKELTFDKRFKLIKEIKGTLGLNIYEVTK